MALTLFLPIALAFFEGLPYKEKFTAPGGNELARHPFLWRLIGFVEVHLARFNLQQYARRGAEARAAELNAELEGIYQAFPDMRRDRAAANSPIADSQTAPSPRARRRTAMSSAQRRAVSARMKKYWAERRKAQAK